jgi:hypothetical protein
MVEFDLKVLFFVIDSTSYLFSGTLSDSNSTIDIHSSETHNKGTVNC